jgi:hypothetical protein
MKNLQPKHYIGIGIFILVVLIIIFPSSSDKNQEDLQKGQVLPSSQQEEEYKSINEDHSIDFDINLENRNLDISGNANLPNKSVLNISISRYVEYKIIEGESLVEQADIEGKRVVDLGDGNAVVKDGKFSFSINLTDKNWYEQDLKENDIMGIDFKKIYEDCYVLITFTPKMKQTNKVYEILGKNFENLNIEKEEGTFKSIQVNKEFKLPLEEGVIK